jgi:hypothetical protein
VGTVWSQITGNNAATRAKSSINAHAASPSTRAILLRISAIVFFTTAVSSIVFQSTTFALPKVFDERLQDISASATRRGQIAFFIFALASIAQLIVGFCLDRLGPRIVFRGLAAVQAAFFGLMPGLINWPALLCPAVFMLATFGQIPINDYMIGKTAAVYFRARVYAVRYVVSFTVLAFALPLIAFIYERWGFDLLFRVLTACAASIFIAVALLPR